MAMTFLGITKTYKIESYDKFFIVDEGGVSSKGAIRL